MRLITCLVATILVAGLNSTPVYAQAAGDEQTEPYRKHRDVRHGHDHVYPDRGAIVRDLPHGAVTVNYAGVSYRFDGGVWYEPRGPAFVVVDPPIGLLVPALPGFATPVVHAGETYMYANGVYYRARPELGGYEVVNEPAEVQASRASAAVGEGVAPSPEATQRKSALSSSSGSMGLAVPALASAATLAGAGATALPNSAASAAPITAAPAAVTPAAALASPANNPAANNPAAAQATGSGPLLAPSSGPIFGAALAASTGTGAIASAPPGTTVSASPTSAPPATAAVPGSTSASTLSGSASSTTSASSLGSPASVPASASAPAVAGPTATPSGTSSPSVNQLGPRVFVYPRTGQSSDQQARDRYECYRFAVAQTGFDPMHFSSAGQSPRAEQLSDYERAQAACLEGRGYSVR